MVNGTSTELLEDVLSEEKQASKLILHNDEHNTFEWVISCLMDVLKMSSANAEQVSYIVHFKGKCTIKSGSYEDLKLLKEGLIDRGLNVTIEN